MTILNIKNIIDIFYSNNDPQQNFKQKLIKSFPLSENNPYNTADPYDSSHEIFVNRETVNTVLNGQGNYALYGGRRIGKPLSARRLWKELKINLILKHFSFLALHTSSNLGLKIIILERVCRLLRS